MAEAVRFAISGSPKIALPTMDFRLIAVSEIDAAYQVYLDAFQWLKAKGIRQWIHALPREALARRQERGELFGYYANGGLAAVVTLAFESSEYWIQELGVEKRWWVKTLAVVRRHAGAGVGQRVIQSCEQRGRDAGATAIFLDCVDTGFLPDYYVRLGYREIGNKQITYPSGNAFQVALMTKEN
jgi:GNAT superfamily N-acetyltransferase